MDHVAVDLARLLGSMVGDDATMRFAGLRGYTNVRSLSEEEVALIAVLDKTGAILGIANWLLWLCDETKRFEDLDGVARRLDVLVTRIESWTDELWFGGWRT
jgi:Ser/Thr protein kinase RdoA (MazF antagonist)